jgi:hypothetical protein
MDQHLLNKVNADSTRIFRERSGQPQLQLSIIDKSDNGAGQCVLNLQPKMQINQTSELKAANAVRDRVFFMFVSRGLENIDLMKANTQRV